MAVDDLWYLRKRDVATGERLPSKRHGRGKRWRVRYTDDSGEKVERLFGKKADADRFDAEARTDVHRGLYIDPAAGKVTVQDYAEQWRTAQMHRDSTAGLIERTFRLHVNPVMGSRPIASIRSTHMQAWVKNLDLAPSTARIVHSHVVSMFGAAVRDRAIAVSPCSGITLPELPHAEHQILTQEQVHALARALPPRFRAMVYVGAGCGLRPSEVFGLELTHVDFLRQEVAVVQQLRTATGRNPFVAPLKTRTSRRVVELAQPTAEALARHLERFPATEVQVSDETDARNVRTRPAKLLFTADGDPISRSVWSKTWAPAARTVGLPSGTGFHALRHYFATLLIFAGANVKTVQMALGHSSPTITLDTYLGLWPDQIDRTRNLVAQGLGPVPLEAMAT
jgi:integrase